LIAFVCLVILFFWLNFVLAQGIESIGREIQVKNEELRALERQNNDLMREVSVAGSEQSLAQRAKSLGYRVAAPVYLIVDEPLAVPKEDAGEIGSLSAALMGEERQAQQFNPLWDLLGRQFGFSQQEPAP
jgi:hypothetical protein